MKWKLRITIDYFTEILWCFFVTRKYTYRYEDYLNIKQVLNHGINGQKALNFLSVPKPRGL